MYKKYARIALVAVLLISGLGIYHLQDLSFDYDFENFFPVGDPDLDFYLKHREAFSNDNDYLLIGIKQAPTVFDHDFLEKVDTLTKSLSSLSRMESVMSPTNLNRPIIGPMGLVQVPYLHWDEPDRYMTDSSRIYANPRLVESVFSKDGQAVCLVLRHKKINKAQGDSLVASINQWLDQLDFQETHLAGKARAAPVYLGKIQEELIVFLSASLVLIILFLTLAYRALWAVVVPLLVVSLSAVWILGFMGAVGKPLDIMMVLLPTIIFVVGMSDVVHILTRYIEELRHGQNKIDALLITFKEVGLATFLTSLTTAIGFLTLYSASIKPIKEFGLYTALGVFAAYILAFALLPSVLVFLKKPAIVDRQRQYHLWAQAMRNLMIITLRKRNTIILVVVLMLVISVVGLLRLRVNAYLIDDIPKDDPLRKDFLFFDQDFGGSRPFEMALEVKDDTHSIWDLEVLRELEQVEAYLSKEQQIGHLNSPLNLVKSLYQATQGGGLQHYKLPQDQMAYDKLIKYLKRFRETKSEVALAGGTKARLGGRMNDIGSYLSLIKNKELQDFLDREIRDSHLEYKVTGTSLLIDKNNEYLVNNMLGGLAIAFGAVALIVGLLFRSVRMVAIALITNSIPLIFVAGIMGLFGIPLKLTTSVIFTIAFGIAVDDTIHFISKLKLELAKGRSKLYALKRTYLSTGKAIVVTTMILAGGFFTLILSSFGGTFYTGLFVSLTLLFALVIDLTLLPVLVVLWYRPK